MKAVNGIITYVCICLAFCERSIMIIFNRRQTGIWRLPGEASLISFSYLLLLSLIKSSKLWAKLKSANLLSVGNTTRKLNRRRRSNLGCSYRSVLVIRGKELLRFFPGQNFAKDSDSEKKFKFLYLNIYISLYNYYIFLRLSRRRILLILNL